MFILPSGGKLELDYLDLLHAHWVVDHATVASGAARANAAKSILGAMGEGAGGEGKGPSQVPAGPRPTRPAVGSP